MTTIQGRPGYSCGLITGASSGLGLEFARQLAPVTQTLVLVARRENLLHEIATDLVAAHPALTVKTIPTDLTDPAQRLNLIRSLEQNQLQPDLLINNAGLGDYGEFQSSAWPKIREILQVNIEALTHLTHALLPSLVAQKGAILNLSSLASILPIPDFAVYAASKAYVTSFSEALRLELRDHRVRVLAACPGPVQTNFGQVARRHSDSPIPTQDRFYVPADQVVRESLRALAHDCPRHYPGLKVAAAAALIGLLPVAAVRLLMSFRPRKST